MPGAGASSMTFWWRRCSEQSRSLRWMALPWRSAKICISIWRGALTYFSISTRSSPKADFRLALGGGERGFEIGVAVDAAHALAAAAGHRLDQHRIADLVGLLLEEFRLLHLAVIAGHHRHAGFLHQRLGAVLQAHGADRRGRRADEDDAGIDAGLREVGVLRQEAVAGMDAVGARRLRGGDQFVDAQIAVGRRRRADGVRLVGRAAHAARARRPPNRPRWCAGRAAWRCGRCGRRFRRDWRSGRS